jgi:hypothetical protein
VETVEAHRRAIHRVLDEYRAFLASQTSSDVDTEVISDDEHGQYMLMRIGWRGETRVRRALFYLRLRNDRIWIEEDWTKDGIANELVQAGVPRQNIVLAFQEPVVRSAAERAA